MNILIISTNDNHALSITQCISSVSNMKVYVMGMNKFSAIMLSRYCRKYFKYELCDLVYASDNIVDNINNCCKQKKIDIIIPSGIESTLFLSKIKEKIITAKVFPLADFEMIKCLNNKWTFGQLMINNNIPYPKTILINNLNEITSLKIEFPVIVKQLELEAGKGVSKLNSAKELETYMFSDNKFNKLPLLIQEYIPGTDMGFNVLAKNGKIVAWVIQKWYPDKDIIEFINDDNILSIGKQIISCCNYTGVANIDLRLDSRDNSVKVIECNPRFWGSLIYSMWSGVNFPYLGVLIAQNKDLPNNTICRNIRYVVPNMFIHGMLKKISLNDINKRDLCIISQVVSDPLLYSNIMMKKLTSYIKNKLVLRV